MSYSHISTPCRLGLFSEFVAVLLACTLLPASAADLLNDPKGFHGIPWGASLESNPDFMLVAPGERVKGYDLKNGPAPLGEVRVDSMRFFSLNNKFARVAIRYRGKHAHNQILAYLQSHFGAADQAPGEMMRGLNQQFTWKGTDSQVNLTYEDMGERGFLFFESRVLAPQFLDNLGGG